MKFDPKENELHELATKFKTDKGIPGNNFMQNYYTYFRNIKNDRLKILEIGVLNGSSLKTWKEFFPNAHIYAIDINQSCKEYEEDRIEIFIGDQTDEKFLDGVMSKLKGVDIIIDDGGHKMTHQKRSFDILFKYLNQDGIYIIEDLITSYWSEYMDAPQTMISYLKTLIDFVNFRQYGDQLSESEKYLVKNIYSIHFYHSICFILKGTRRTISWHKYKFGQKTK